MFDDSKLRFVAMTAGSRVLIVPCESIAFRVGACTPGIKKLLSFERFRLGANEWRGSRASAPLASENSESLRAGFVAA